MSAEGLEIAQWLQVGLLCRQVRSDITSGQTPDNLGFELVMGDNLPEPCVLLGDRGYDSDNSRKPMEACSVVPVIPMR